MNEEKAKRDLRSTSPKLSSAIDRLEDHSILRGTLAAFELDATITARAQAFEAIFDPVHWPAVTGALIATGEYQRDYPNSDQHRFGSPTTESVWRLLLVDRGDRTSLARIRAVLGELLDRVSASDHDPETCLSTVVDDFIQDRTARSEYDWRYYLARYPEMREGNSGIYYGADQRLGYEMTMLRKTVQSSYYRDAYLYAMWSRAGKPDEVKDPWFYGYSTTPRWMELHRSEASLRNVPAGIAVRPSPAPAPAQNETLREICEASGAAPLDDGWLLPVPQSGPDDERVDTVDRVVLAAALLEELISAGL